jgi:Protein of unknown function (DUF1573)
MSAKMVDRRRRGGMRKVLFAWLILLAGTPVVSAQGWANKLFKDQLSHDFGTVARGAQLYHRFPLTNLYAVPLDVTTRVSCTCVTATPDKKTLQPRESGYIEITMDARRFNGAKSVTVFVTVGPTFISTAELTVTANCRADVVFNPGQVSFGSVNAGQAASQTIDIEYAGALDWRITEAITKDLPFEATYKELYRRPGQVGYQITVSLKPDVPAGVLKRELQLRTNDPTTPLIGVLVEANVQSALSLSPEVLRLGPIQVGDTLVRKVVVRGQKPFKVLGVEGLGDGITLASEPSTTSAGTQVITFKIQPEKPGEIRKQFSIKTDHEPAPLALTIEASVAAN